jgi:hypothetical protein
MGSGCWWRELQIPKLRLDRGTLTHECTGTFVTLWTKDLHYNPLKV